MRPAFAQAKSLIFLDTQFFVDEYRAVFPVNVTAPMGLIAVSERDLQRLEVWSKALLREHG